MNRLITSLFFLNAGVMIGAGGVILFLGSAWGLLPFLAAGFSLWRGVVWTRRDEASA